MRPVSLFFAAFLCFLPASTALSDETAANPTEEIRIPRTLNEAHEELERIFSPELLAKIDAMKSEKEMIEFHFSIGMGLRNSWGLWKKSPLAEYFRTLGFVHPDDMSAAILETFWCKRHGMPFRVEERAARSKAFHEAFLKQKKQEKERAAKVAARLKTMMMGVVWENQDAPLVRMPDRTNRELRARFLAPFREGAFISVRQTLTSGEVDAYRTEGFYYAPGDRKIHPIRIKEVGLIHSAVVLGKVAWFTGVTDGKSVLVGINESKRNVLPLPREEQPPPQLGIDGQALLAVYPNDVFRLTDSSWERIYHGDTPLPYSGPPPRLVNGKLYLRDEGVHEDDKRLWWLSLGARPELTSLDQDLGVVGSSGPRWENSYSAWCAPDGGLWATLGGIIGKKSVAYKAPDGAYSLAILHNGLRWTPDLFGSKETDEGISVTAITGTPDGALLMVGDSGFYRLKGKSLLKEWAFENTRQKIPIEGGKNVSHWDWIPNHILILNDTSFLISGEFGGIYLLHRDKGESVALTSLDENPGEPLEW